MTSQKIMLMGLAVTASMVYLQADDQDHHRSHLWQQAKENLSRSVDKSDDGSKTITTNATVTTQKGNTVELERTRIVTKEEDGHSWTTEQTATWEDGKTRTREGTGSVTKNDDGTRDWEKSGTITRRDGSTRDYTNNGTASKGESLKKSSKSDHKNNADNGRKSRKNK